MTVMMHAIALEGGQSSQGTSEPITPVSIARAQSPLEMCAKVGGFVRWGARSYVWRVTTVPVCLLYAR